VIQYSRDGSKGMIIRPSQASGCWMPACAGMTTEFATRTEIAAPALRQTIDGRY
jgi:hypothetical protein